MKSLRRASTLFKFGIHGIVNLEKTVLRKTRKRFNHECVSSAKNVTHDEGVELPASEPANKERHDEPPATHGNRLYGFFVVSTSSTRRLSAIFLAVRLAFHLEK